MNKLERLEQEAYDANVKVHTYYLGEENLKGFYASGHIAINTSVHDSTEKVCILAEELGHHYTSVGNILDMRSIQNRKQERQARLWGYNKLIGLTGLIEAYEQGCQNSHEIAEFLEVTEEFLFFCVETYMEKYGEYTEKGSYIIYFIPTLAVLKKI